jgi:SAM-dependent MidA family methyltransferase
LSEVAAKIAGEIEERGAISFERFMTLALYCPICGYYEKEGDSIGRRGDYYTSVSVGSLFGELLAFQFAEWLEKSPGWSTLRQAPSAEAKAGGGIEAMRIVEAGAHDGRLAKDVLGWLHEQRPGLFERLEYWIVEPSDRRRGWQERKLGELGTKVRWVPDLAGLTGTTGSAAPVPQTSGLRGIVFSNELLDAMPVHRLGWDANKGVWFEWGVTLRAGRFVWTRLAGGEPGDSNLRSGEPSPISHRQLPIEKEVLEILPDGFSTEWCPAAEEWWHMAAVALEVGKLLTLDYGLTKEELLRPERKEGTLRGYCQHQPCSDVLAYPGEQDITGHVNFTGIRAAGESAGLKTDEFLTQSQFLTRIAARAWENQDSFGEWTPERTRQFRTLIHPEHLGRSLRVLVQSRT